MFVVSWTLGDFRPLRSRKTVPILYGSELLDDPQNQDDGDCHSERDQKAVVFLSVFRFGML